MKYVALLAFTKIVGSHPQLVALHQDVIVECIDDPDISIRTRALELVTGMVDPNNLVSIVERLLRQLREAREPDQAYEPENDRGLHGGVDPSGEMDDEQAGASLRKNRESSNEVPPLPEDYRISVIERILEMCSRDTYTNISDFDWYIGVLVDLVRHCPAKSAEDKEDVASGVADTIGSELRNVAVRVKSVRPEAVAAAQSLVLFERRQDLFPASGTGALAVLESAAWIAGEYPDLLPDPQAVLTSLTHSSSTTLPAGVLTIYVQAVPKVFVRLTSSQRHSWTGTRKSQTALLMARIIHFLEPLIQHPNLEVQERAVEYLEVMRVTSEAASAHPTETDEGFVDAPLLITQAIPSLFMGMELNPVAAGALAKVPLTEGLDLDTPLNSNLQALLQRADYDDDEAFTDDDQATRFYLDRPTPLSAQPVAAAQLLEPPKTSHSYQQDDRTLSADALAKKKAERAARYKDDPFYIDSEKTSGTSTPLHNILKSSNGEELDIDAIPIMDLHLDNLATEQAVPSRSKASKVSSKKSKRRVEIAAEETIPDDPATGAVPLSSTPPLSLLPSLQQRTKKSLLEVDSSGLARLSLSLQDDTSNLHANGHVSQLEMERRRAEEEEMERAMKEVERVRLEMQRERERVVESGGSGADGAGVRVVRKKARKTSKKVLGETGGNGMVEDEGETGAQGIEGDGVVEKKKKKKTKVRKDEEAVEVAEDKEEEMAAATASTAVKAKKKKKRRVVFDDGDDA